MELRLTTGRLLQCRRASPGLARLAQIGLVSARVTLVPAGSVMVAVSDGAVAGSRPPSPGREVAKTVRSVYRSEYLRIVARPKSSG